MFKFSEISRLLTGDRTNIRANYKGDKYHDAINELKEFEKHWKAKYLTGLKNQKRAGKKNI